MRNKQPGLLDREELQHRNRASINQGSSQRSNASVAQNISTNEEQNSIRLRHITKRIPPNFIGKNSIAVNNPEANKTRAETENRTVRQENSLPSQFRSSDQTSGNSEKTMSNQMRTPERKRIYLKEEPRANLLHQIQNFQRKPSEGTEKKRENKFPLVSQYKPQEAPQTQGQMMNSQRYQLNLQNIHEDEISTFFPGKEPEVNEVKIQQQRMNFIPLFKLFDMRAKIPPHELKKAVQMFFHIEIKRTIGICSQLSSPCTFSMKDSKGLEEDLEIKQKEIEILHEILNLFREHIKKEEALHCWDENYKKTSQKIWTYLFQGYHDRFKDFSAHYLQKMTREGTNNHITSQHPDRVLTRIEELNKIWKPYESIWQAVKNKNFEENLKKTQKKRQKVNISYSNLELQNDLSLSDMTKTQKILSDQSVIILKENKKWKSRTDLNKTRDKWRSNQVHDHNALSKIFKTQHRVISRYKLSSSWINSDERSTYQKQTLTVLFTFAIFWYSDKDRTFVFQEQFNKMNTLELHGDPSFEDIDRELAFQLKLDFCNIIKPYASIEIASIERTQNTRQYKVHLDIAQNVIDLPKGYSWTVASWKNNSLVASALVISNQNGSAEWIEDVDLKGVCFSQENFGIGDRQIKCEIRELNKPCLVTFNGLPDNLLTSKSQRSIRLFQDFVMGMGPVELAEINFEKNTFTVKFATFSFEGNEKQLYDSKLPDTASKSQRF